MGRSSTARRLALAGLLIAGTAFATVAEAQSGKTITGGFDVGPGGLPKNFNPLVSTAGFTWLSTYFEPLIIWNAELTELKGSLAKDWKVSDDQLTYTFNLAKETWHDGKPFTSKDVKFTFDLARNKASGSLFAARLGDIQSVETPDDRTVVIKLSKPNGSFLAVITQVLILPEHALAGIAPEQLANSKWWSTTPVGTGPFKFKQYVTDQYVELSADDDYRGGKPKVDTLINRYFENPAAAVAALRAGEIQFTYVEPDDAATFKNDSNYTLIEGGSYVVNYIGLNQKVDLFKDPKVRQAIMYAIDRNAIVESLYGGAAKVANCGYVAPHLVPEGLEPFAYDPEKAKALLAEAGWDKINGDKPITLLTYYSSPQAANVTAAIQSMLAQVGVNIVPRVVDTPTYNGIVYKQGTPDWNAFPMIYAGLQNGPNPAGLNPGLNKSQLPPAGFNTMRIEFDDLSAAFDAALGQIDPAKVNASWQDVCKAMNKDLPWATLWVANRYGVASKKLKDFVWTPAPAGGPYAAHPELWDIQ
ncbi:MULTISPECIES: ABC transporter substrate-binding protein [unclassified Mesorhizobium]|uniref:ABC transporter substrate-binding protein n=1 Tax=unclassified Mesorhizobium TaxID=325217 RepID=UPI000F751464|nr:MULTISPECIES: ABC transporter substrate-binding protein [unclassified Mesorhizobium]AZO31901.1 ABC transporter substrate-binding protein [Mesorhizobium sp. M1B.F.Ca.ET.045.04.1.1]RWB21044.1 MAG: ABC transporter substrate-binding protein [Mesorhizobium sp.]